MRSPLGLAALTTVVLLAFAPIARAGGVRVVESSGTQNYADIVSAVAVAPDGAVILVGAGSYGGFSINGKSLSIFAVPGANVNVTGPVQVIGLADTQTVVLSGLRVVDGASSPQTRPALEILACAGQVRVQQCSFKAYDYFAGFCPGFPLQKGGPGARVTSSDRVAFTKCTITGGRGEGLDPNEMPGCAPAAEGGAGIEALGSTLALYEVTATGGEGGGAEFSPARGGAGLELPNGTMLASASVFTGGRGGQNFFMISPPPCGGPGGTGCVLSASSTLHEIACTFAGGSQGFFPCGGPGASISGGTPNSFAGPARIATIAPLVKSDLGSWTVSFQGDPNDKAYLLTSLPSGFQIAPAFHGAWLVLRSALLPVQFLGIGNLVTSVPAPDLTPGSLLERRWSQVAVRASGSVYLGSGAVLLLLDRDSGPDCDGNGLNDFVQVIESPAQDANQNLIPDVCPGG